MDWLKRMNDAIDYIENHLTDEIDYEVIARKACCSQYNFQRMFSFITDVPLSEYIRRRKLTLAAFELQNTSTLVIELAFKYGYDSPNSFTRAFQLMHGVTPSSARNKGVQLKAYPRLSFHITIKGDIEMNYKIVEKESFTVFGIEKVFTTVNGENLKEIPAFWQNSMRDGSFERLCAVANGEPKGVHAVMCYRDTGRDTFPYMICAFAKDGNVPNDFTPVQIPALTWAIFTTEEHTKEQTSHMVQDLFKRIYSEWLPTSGYELLDGPEFEMYGTSKNGLEYCEVWIPIKK